MLILAWLLGAAVLAGLSVITWRLVKLLPPDPPATPAPAGPSLPLELPASTESASPTGSPEPAQTSEPSDSMGEPDREVQEVVGERGVPGFVEAAEVAPPVDEAVDDQANEPPGPAQRAEAIVTTPVDAPAVTRSASESDRLSAASGYQARRVLDDPAAENAGSTFDEAFGPVSPGRIVPEQSPSPKDDERLSAWADELTSRRRFRRR